MKSNLSFLRNATILLMVLSSYLFAQQDTLQYYDWIKTWHLLGPIQLEENSNEINHLPGFDNGVLSHEDNGIDINIGSSNLDWIKYTSPDSIINLDVAISNKTYVAAYAYKEIYAKNEGTYIIALGTNDGGRLWVNGMELWDYPGARGLTPDDNLIPVFLNKGKNEIHLKVEERGNSWGFCFRIIPFNIESFVESGKIFNIVTLTNGTSELRYLLNENVADNLFADVNLEVYTDDYNPELIFTSKWPKTKKYQLDIDNKEYRPYLLKIIAKRIDGKIWETEIKFYSGKRVEYSLFSNKTTDYKIVVALNASESEKWAASELQKYFMEISGASFPIIDDNSKLAENEIIVGYNKHSKKLLGEKFVEPSEQDESFIYKNVNSNIILVGGKQRGTMYSTFSFLENIFGIRWYTSEVTNVPKRENYSFSYLNHSDKPSTQVRNDFYFDAFNPLWAAHNKINGAMGFREQHGDIEGYWSVHTFYRFMPPSEFYDQHPEYYSLIDGRRIHDHAQLCLTNPDVLEIITERLKNAIKKYPSNLIYSVSQNDWRNPCQCNKCQAIVDKEESQSGIMVWFVNQVADRIREEYPNKYVGTLAYQYTRSAPKNIKPRENVVIRLCSIECCFSHDFKTCPENKAFLSDLKNWSDISPHLYIWDYVVNFSHYIMPYPNFGVLQSNIKTFNENSSIGIMEQAAYQSKGGEFAELRSYVISKLLWNEESNVNEIIDDFIYGYYGRSGQSIKKYFELLHNQVLHNTHIHLGLRPDDKIFTEKFIIEADKIFDKAETTAENEIIKKRVELARLPLMYLKCKRNPLNAKSDGTYNRFIEIVEREGITHFAEAGEPHIRDFHHQIKNAK